MTTYGSSHFDTYYITIYILTIVDKYKINILYLIFFEFLLLMIHHNTITEQVVMDYPHRR